jgi:hypothetical protein
LDDAVDVAVALAQGVQGSGPLVHGDFTWWNFIGMPKSFTLLDWEASSDVFVPMADLVRFVVTDGARLGRLDAPNVLAKLVAPGSAGERYCDRIGHERGSAPGLARRALARETPSSELARSMLELLE